MIGEVDPLGVPAQGAHRDARGETHFCLWAPHHKHVELVLNPGRQKLVRAMQPGDDGHFRHVESGLPRGARYAYRAGQDSRELPDPASRWQPDGVHNSSAVFDPNEFNWSDGGWPGIAPDRLAIYELHVGTFTPEGTFAAIIPRLRDLAELGITSLELMPIAQFPGLRNWGYDGVHPFAVQNSYGGPHGLQQLVDAAHRAGVGVILDVVYNHLGPEGNYFDVFAPYFTERYHTPWGRALNYDDRDSDPVRRLAIDNAAMWIRDFHVDGLRLDAVQTIYDESAKHLLDEMQETVQRIAREQHRHVVVIAETNQNDVRLVTPAANGGYGLDGMWADDFHHSVHALLTGERDGYYEAFGTPEHLAKALRDGAVYDGRYSPFHRRRQGNRLHDAPRERLVTCLQNHDQVGNRALGDRLASLLSPEQLRLAAALLLLAPTTPLLFMGEEYGEPRPFPFFCSFGDGRLIEAVRRGRRAELASIRFHWKIEPPDPHSAATMESARLSWSWENPAAAGLRALYRDLLCARNAWPGMLERHVATASIKMVDASALLHLVLGRDTPVVVWANLSPQPVRLPSPTRSEVPVFSTAVAQYGGARSLEGFGDLLEPWELAAWGATA